MNIQYKKQFLVSLSVTLCLLFAVTIRAYNINYESLWFDEILSFWVADPLVTISESFERHKSIEQIPFLYNLTLKIIFKIFGYNENIGRHLSLIFNIFGIFFIFRTSSLLKKNNSFILTLFLLSTNIYLITYSQELRPYSLIFFLCSLNIFLFCKIIKTSVSKEIKMYDLCSYCFVQILMILSHPFCLIIFFSTTLFLIFKYIKDKKIIKIFNISFWISLIFSLVYFFYYLKSTSSFPGWIEQPGIKFYTNFYFSNFFGSRIMGLIHLIILLSLITLFIKKFKNEFFNLNIFLIIIFLSYSLPLIFGYIFKPIIFPRYIIFVLIPTIILLSFLTFEINNKIIKNGIIIILVSINLGNHFTESTFQQFIKEKTRYKPEFKAMINLLNESSIKNYALNLSMPESKRLYVDRAIKNYISKLSINQNIKLNHIYNIKEANSHNKKIWIICLTNISKNKCRDSKSISSFKTLKIVYFSGIKLMLIGPIK